MFGERSVGNWPKLVLSFYCVGSGDETQGARLDGKFLYPPGHLADPKFTMLYYGH